LPKDGNEEDNKNLLEILRRAIREGGAVPEAEVFSLFSEVDGTYNDAGEALLRLVLGDYGAETDKRLEPAGSAGVWEQRESDDEDIFGTVAFLDDLGSGRNDPMRLMLATCGVTGS
jgi:RNA polymerase primary sigma factor